jgi:hypothetical protein
VLLYTGLRVGDAYRFGKQHVQAGEMKTEKTGQIVYPEIGPSVPPLGVVAGECRQ